MRPECSGLVGATRLWLALAAPTREAVEASSRCQFHKQAFWQRGVHAVAEAEGECLREPTGRSFLAYLSGLQQLPEALKKAASPLHHTGINAIAPSTCLSKLTNTMALFLESTPKTFEPLDDEDEPMPDAVAEQEDAEPEQEVEEEADKDDGSAAEEEAAEEDEEKSPTPPPEPVIRRRRLGRPPKNRPPDWDTLPIEPPNPDATPRRRGRGGWRGRGGRKGQHHQPTQQSIDKDGTVLDIVNDEVDLPKDPEGEKKVDDLGNLLDGREYRCRTFTLAGRGDRLYMLSTEPARCVGFRDSYLFFTKHKKLYKIIVNDEEKRDMIERDIIPHSYKGRSIGIVTARSVFREFGALIIVGGRRIVDDYDVAKAREEGLVEGELADPTDVYSADQPYNKNQYVAWHGASAVYHSGGPSVPQQSVKVDTKKKRVAVNDVNWQLEHAREAR